MTLRRAAWLCLGSGAGLLAFAWVVREGDWFFLLLVVGFVAVMAGSHLLTAAIQMPRAKPGAGDPA